MQIAVLKFDFCIVFDLIQVLVGSTFFCSCWSLKLTTFNILASTTSLQLATLSFKSFKRRNNLKKHAAQFEQLNHKLARLLLITPLGQPQLQWLMSYRILFYWPNGNIRYLIIVGEILDNSRRSIIICYCIHEAKQIKQIDLFHEKNCQNIIRPGNVTKFQYTGRDMIHLYGKRNLWAIT